MNENLKIFLEKVSADTALQQRFADVRDPEEAYRLASEIQGGFTKEEFIAEMTRIRNAMEENLSDEDLARSSGGVSKTQVLTLVEISVYIASPVVASAL